jgi:hypothetical protein
MLPHLVCDRSPDRSRENLISAIGDLAPDIREREIIHGAQESFASIQPRRPVQSLAEPFDNRGSHKPCIPVRSLCDALECSYERVASVVTQAALKRADSLCLANCHFSLDQVPANYFNAACEADNRERFGIFIATRQPRVKELLRRGLCDVAVYGSVGGGLLRSVCLNYLAWHFVKIPLHGGRCSMLPVNNSVKAAFYRRHNDRGEFRPIEMLCYALNVLSTFLADFPLIGAIDHKLFDLEPCEHWSGPGRARFFRPWNSCGLKLSKHSAASTGLTMLDRAKPLA